jgi:predicted aconitase
MYGSRCERYDGVSSLAAAITGYVPLTGAHLDENRNAEVVIRLGDDLRFEHFTDADWDAFSLAASRKCQDKRPLFVGVPRNAGVTAFKHLLAVIAVESGLAVLHIEGVTPEAATAKDAFMGKECRGEFIVGKRELDEAYDIANTTDEKKIDYVLLGCPHLTMKEIRDVARELRGNKLSPNVRLTVSTTAMLLNQAEDMGYADDIRNAGGVMTSDMCIAFAGTRNRGVIATNSIKAVFFYAGFSSDGSRRVRFGSTSQCARAAVSGLWEGR